MSSHIRSVSPGADGSTLAEVRSLHDAVDQLRRMGLSFLEWTGKAEKPRLSVPTVPLFVHERLSTEAIIKTLKGHKKDQQTDLFDQLFGVEQRSLADQAVHAYEHAENWTNRMVLGDSLVVMNSLLQYEHLAGQVQMIYMDPPYGVKFGSNFQPFVRKRAVGHNDDNDFTREPEMVQAYRDTWELGLHSYLTYLRDRLKVAKDLLHATGSIFVQINDANAHHVRELLDAEFGYSNFVSQIFFQTTSGFETKTIATMGDYLLWYAKDKERVKVRKVYQPKAVNPGDVAASWLLMPDGTYRGVAAEERRGEIPLPKGAKLYKPDNLLGQGPSREPQPFDYLGKVYNPPSGSHWKASYPEGMRKLAEAGRIHVAKNSIQYRRFSNDFQFTEIGNTWTDTLTGSFLDDKVYAVQTNEKVVERCLHMTTEPGGLGVRPPPAAVVLQLMLLKCGAVVGSPLTQAVYQWP
jgi:adenine-specific DNA-methyltransferase